MGESRSHPLSEAVSLVCRRPLAAQLMGMFLRRDSEDYTQPKRPISQAA